MGYPRAPFTSYYVVFDFIKMFSGFNDAAFFI